MVKRIFILIILYIILLYSPLSADIIEDYLDITKEAKMAGSGEALVTEFNSIHSLLYHGASLHGIRNNSLLLSTSFLSMDRMGILISYASESDTIGKYGISFLNYSIFNIPLYSNEAAYLGDQNAYFNQFQFSYLLPSLFIFQNSVSCKVLYEKIYTESRKGISFNYDINLHYQPMVMIMNLENILGILNDSYAEETKMIPPTIVMGIGLYQEKLFLYKEKTDKGDIGIKLVFNTGSSITRLHLGLQYIVYLNQTLNMAFRSGYANKEINFGLGLTYLNFTFNYAFSIDNLTIDSEIQKYNNRISLSYAF